PGLQGAGGAVVEQRRVAGLQQEQLEARRRQQRRTERPGTPAGVGWRSLVVAAGAADRAHEVRPRAGRAAEEPEAAVIGSERRIALDGSGGTRRAGGGDDALLREQRCGILLVVEADAQQRAVVARAQL